VSKNQYILDLTPVWERSFCRLWIWTWFFQFQRKTAKNEQTNSEVSETYQKVNIFLIW